MELIQAGQKTYYIKNATNAGIYLINDNDVILIDSGNDKDAGKKILKITDSQGWNIKGIISTHSNADHIGGNKLIHDRTGCEIYSFGIEAAFAEFPVLEPSFLYGANPFKELKNKFLMANPTPVIKNPEALPDGIECISLGGHFFDMIGIKTDDDIYFLADSLFSRQTIEKYHLFFIYDVKAYVNTLEYLGKLDGKLFIPSHTEAVEDPGELITLNREKIFEIADLITLLAGEGNTAEEILKGVFDHYDLVMNANQFVLLGSTVRSYLTYLYEEGKVTYEFIDNRMIWKKV